MNGGLLRFSRLFRLHGLSLPFVSQTDRRTSAQGREILRSTRGFIVVSPIRRDAPIEKRPGRGTTISTRHTADIRKRSIARAKNPSKVGPYSARLPTECPQMRRPRKCSYKPPHSVNRGRSISSSHPLKGYQSSSHPSDDQNFITHPIPFSRRIRQVGARGQARGAGRIAMKRSDCRRWRGGDPRASLCA